VTGRGSIGHFLILKVLERAHIAPGSVDLIFMAPADAAAALRSGAVDAWATWGPYVATAEAAGNRILADGRDYFSACSFDVVHESVLRQNPKFRPISCGARRRRWCGARIIWRNMPVFSRERRGCLCPSRSPPRKVPIWMGRSRPNWWAPSRPFSTLL
jgi:hypothetical protein